MDVSWIPNFLGKLKKKLVHGPSKFWYCFGALVFHGYDIPMKLLASGSYQYSWGLHNNFYRVFMAYSQIARVCSLIDG